MDANTLGTIRVNFRLFPANSCDSRQLRQSLGALAIRSPLPKLGRRRNNPGFAAETFHSPDPSPWSALASLPVRPATCTLAACARRCSAGCSPGGTAGSFCCGSTTPIRSGTSRRPWPRSCTAFAGWASIGTKDRRSAGRTRPIINRSGCRVIRRRSKSCWPAASPIAITPRRTSCRPSASRRKPRSGRFSTAAAGWPRSAADQARFEAEGRQGVVRLKMPREGKLVIDDHVRGDVEFEWAREQDHVIQRADGTCLYHLASVVDDFDFEITHVIRAEEHLSNTPRQIFIAQSLGYPLPEYAHLPFVAEPGSKNKLSKRKLDKYLKNRDFAQLMEHGQRIAAALGLQTSAETFNPVIVDFYEQVGYLPDAIINYLLLLGWSLDDKTEFFTRDEMIANFSLERVTKAPASFDPKKLWAFEDHYMQALPLKQKVALVLPYLQRAGLGVEPAPLRSRAEAHADRRGGRRPAEGGRRHSAVCRLFLHRPDRVRSAGGRKKPPQAGGLALLARFKDRLAAVEPFDVEPLEKALQQFVADEGIKIGDIIHALRVAVTGKAVGPGLYDCLAMLGRETSLARIQRTLDELAPGE